MFARTVLSLAVLSICAGGCRRPPEEDPNARGGAHADGQHKPKAKQHDDSRSRHSSDDKHDREDSDHASETNEQLGAAMAADLQTDPWGAISFPPPFDGVAIDTKKDSDGLIIEDFEAGQGVETKAGDEVVVHYTGYLLSGDTFDSSVPRGRPFTFTLGQGRVIKGWDRGIVGMRVGGKRRLIVPAELGYGARAAGKIPPNSTLVFTVELLRIEAPIGKPQGDDAFKGKPLRTDKRDNGLIIDVYAEGSGEAAKAGDDVLVHYTGTLEDGTVFDRSIERDPIRFPLGRGRVIKGWDMGIEGMKVGELRRLVIPAELGYGERARGKIPANAKLTFTVELMGIRAG